MDLKYGAISQQVNGKNKSISISQKKQDSLITEKLHTKFCKYALGARTKSSNIACRGELDGLCFTSSQIPLYYLAF
jgi:hypothetical protein